MGEPVAAITCPHCGVSLQERANFCPKCGRDLRGVAPGGRTLARDGSTPAELPVSGFDRTLPRQVNPTPRPSAGQATQVVKGAAPQAVEPPAELPAGPAVIADRYRVLELLGEGGMGSVFKVEHVKMGKILALKLMRPEFSRVRALVDRFVAEARIVSRLSSPNVVAVTDFGEAQDGSLFLVMEYCPGEDLAHVIERQQRLPERVVAQIGAQVLTALAEAHEQGVVHRDIKPNNVMLVKGRRGETLCKVLDFGIAKLGRARDAAVEGAPRRDPTRANLTGVGEILGTPNYMSPEQARGAELGPSSDLYSTGAMLYELLAGRPPFLAETPMGVLAAHLSEQPKGLRQVAPQAGISAAMEALVARALQKEPAARFASADEMREALEALLADAKLPAPAPAPLAASREGVDDWFADAKLPASAPAKPKEAERDYRGAAGFAPPELDALDTPYEYGGAGISAEGAKVEAKPAPRAAPAPLPPTPSVRLDDPAARERLKLKLAQAEFGLDAAPVRRSRLPFWLVLGVLVAAGALVPLVVLPSAPLHGLLPPEARAKVRTFVGVPTQLSLTSTPPGARVIVDERTLGVTPLEVDVPWPEGAPLAVSVELEGQPAVQLRVLGGRTLRQELSLGGAPAPEPPQAPAPTKRPKKGGS